MLAIANRLATEQGSPDGFRIIINTGRVGHQEVPHLHIHIVGGPEPVGPMLKRI
jgi:histidine triad (HIT) family protein